MTQGPILGPFVRASGKFFHINSPTASGLEFRQRGGTRRSVVAVFDPVRKDYRIKLWLDESAAAGHEAVKSFEHETGHAFRLTHVKDGFYQGQINQAALWRMLQGKPPVDPVDQDDDDQAAARDELKDFCVETRFDLERHEGRGCPGDVSGFPEWMKATGIQIDKDPRGQGTAIYLHTQAGNDGDLRLLRINGQWIPGMPMGGGSWLYSVPPTVEDEVREYGDGLTQIAMPNEPRPPRFPQEVRRICIFLRDNGDRNVPYREWRDDAQQWNYKIFAMCTAHGQGKIYERRLAPTVKRRDHYFDLVSKHYDRRPKAYANYTLAEWLKEVQDKPAEWQGNVDRLNTAIESLGASLDRFDASYQKLKGEFDEITARLEAREEKYADAIELLHPRA